MRFFQVAVVALALLGSLVGGVSAKKHRGHHKNNNYVFSKIAPSQQELEDMFSSYMKQYNKKYSYAEFSSRFQVFKANFERARIHNTEKNASYTLGINEHSDLSFAEFKAKYFGFKPRTNKFRRNRKFHEIPEGFEADAAIDWRSQNGVSYVTPVKNQGQCGACWAFSTTGSTEGAWAIAKQLTTPVSLSEQQLVDCSGAQGNQGCNGGLMDDGFKYIIANGICAESAYPYTAADGTCQSCTSVVTISSSTDVASGDENALLSAVAQQPVSIAIEADQQDFQQYAGGVFSASDCGTTLDHGVLVVGYGTDSSVGQDYWIVKNSWGASWGEAGYIRLIRGQNQCGLANEASYPTV